ncbi:lasso peptide biosynthesis protein [bacterium]|nr:lasso peptide biosynthesis protein [bacterium]
MKLTAVMMLLYELHDREGLPLSEKIRNNHISKIQYFKIILSICWQMKNYDVRFIMVVCREFLRMCKLRECDGCLSTSAMLYLCAKYYGYEPVLCYGVCSFNNIDFYHAWLEFDGKPLDLAVYGNIMFYPGQVNAHLDKPVVLDEKTAVHYINMYDEPVDSDIQIARGHKMTEYFRLDNMRLWRTVFLLLGVEKNYNIFSRLYAIADNSML